MEKRSSAQPSAKRHHCEQCSYSTDYNGNMKQHRRTHTGEKPFKCCVCAKAFTRSGDLRIHQRIHTGEKPFMCTVCWKAFTYLGHLQIHQRTHTGEKPFKCTVCGKAFTQSGGRIRHEKIHNEKTVTLTSENETAALSPTLIKQEPGENPSFETWPGVIVKCEDVQVKCEDEFLIPRPNLQVGGGNVKQENLDCGGE